MIYTMHKIVRCLICFKQKTAYEMRISDWSSDVCSSDLVIVYLSLPLHLLCGRQGIKGCCPVLPHILTAGRRLGYLAASAKTASITRFNSSFTAAVSSRISLALRKSMIDRKRAG